MSESSWEYNCPQFVDFSAPLVDDHNVDAYFNIDHENGGLLQEEEDESFNGTPEEEESLYEDARSERTSAPNSNAMFRKSGQSAGRKKPKTPMSTSKLQAAHHTPQSESIHTTPYNTRARKSLGSPTHAVQDGDDGVDKQDNCQVVPEIKPLVLEGTDSAPVSNAVKEEEDSVEKKLQAPSNLCSSLSAWRSKCGTAKLQYKPSRKSPRIPNGSKKNARDRIKSVPVESRQSPAAKRQRRSLVTTPSLKDECSTPKLQRRRTLSLECSTPGVKPPCIIKSSPEHHSDESTERCSTRSVDIKNETDSKQSGIQHEKSSKPAVKLSLRRSTSLKGLHARSLSAQRDKRHLRSSSVIRRTSADKDMKEKRDNGAPPLKPRLTMPVTPICLKRKIATKTSDAKTTEEMEMERIKLLRQELARKRKMAEESLRKTQTSSGYQPVRSSQPLTRPENIQFATDGRLKAPQNESNNTEATDFVAGLRRSLPSPSRPVRHGPTVPQPFNLTENRKRKREDDNTFHSMAEQIRGFALKTPIRFHTRSKRGTNTSPNKYTKHSSQDTKLTVPKTPNFETRGRKRNIHIVSQQELEEKEVEEMKKYTFKANPINERVMGNHNIGVKRVVPKECTQAIGFDLETENRRELRSSTKHNKSDDATEQHYEFHAQPIPKAILEGPVGLKPVKGIPLTIPESPAFALKNRLRQHVKDIEVQKEEHKLPRPRPVPHTGLPFQPKLDHRITEPQPFSFEDRQQRMVEHKERMIQQVLQAEKKAREFRANPLPDLSPEQLPSKCVKPSTQPQPFVLGVDVRGASKAEEWSHKVLHPGDIANRPRALAQLRIEEELEQQRLLANAFRAKSSKVLHQEPFMPKKSTKPLTDVNDIRLNTDTRAEKRVEWETYLKQHEAEQAAEEAAREREREEEERRQVELLRKQAVHKPQPIRKYKSVEVKPSEKPLTNPHTPNFSDRLRSRNMRT